MQTRRPLADGFNEKSEEEERKESPSAEVFLGHGAEQNGVKKSRMLRKE